MKKVLFAISASLLITLTACGTKPTETAKTENAPTNAPVIEVTQASKTTEKPVATEKPIATTVPKATTAPTQKNELELKSLLNGKLELLVPRSFELMSEEMLKMKYPAQNAPAFVYTNKEGSINIAFNHTQSKLQANEVEKFQKSTKQAFENVQKSAIWYSDGVTDINGKKVGFLELLTPAIDTKIYNLMFFTELDNRLLMCTFNCKENQMKEWKPIAKSIMNSIKVK